MKFLQVLLTSSCQVPNILLSMLFANVFNTPFCPRLGDQVCQPYKPSYITICIFFTLRFLVAFGIIRDTVAFCGGSSMRPTVSEADFTQSHTLSVCCYKGDI